MASGKSTDSPGKKGGERSGVAVVVPTTSGAIQVLGLRWSQRIPSSRVVLGNETSDQCERWTKDYNSLLRAGDPMRTLLGLPEGGGCRLVVSAEIDHGRSWMVPIAAAHFADARAQAVHADTSRARLLIWGTGALDFSQPEAVEQATIVENDYHLTSKIDLSRAHFASAAHDGTPVLCLLPAGGDAERAATILRKVLGQQPHHVEIVASLADVIRPITAYLDKGDFNAPPDMKYAPVPYTPPAEESEEPPQTPPPGSTKAAAARPDAAPTGGPQPTSNVQAEQPPPPFAPTAPPPVRAKGLSVGVLGGIAAALVAVIGVGAVMLRSSPAPAPLAPASPAQTPSAPPVAVVQRPQTVTIPAQPPPVVVTPPQSSPVSVSAPVTVAPPVSAVPTTVAVPPVTAPPPAVAPTAPAAPALPAQPTTDTAVPVGRLTVLTPPSGSSCQAQVLEMNARYVETVVELGSGQPVLEIAGSTICGLAIAGTGAVQARFAPATVSGTVASLSSGSRIIFNPNSASVRLPEIAVSGGPLEKIELRQR